MIPSARPTVPSVVDHFHKTFVSFWDILKSGAGRPAGRTEICAKIIITIGRIVGRPSDQQAFIVTSRKYYFSDPLGPDLSVEAV